MAFAGMRGTGDWATDQRPFAWRKDLLRIFPQGEMPITGMTSNMRTISVNDPKFNRWTKVFPDLAADLSDSCVYEDSNLGVAYSDGDSLSAGETVYCKMSLTNVKQFRPRQLVMLRYSAANSVDIRGEVVSVKRDGANSYIEVELLEDDNTSSPDLSDVDRVMIYSNFQPEGAGAPTPLAFDPSSDYNYTQIFWDTLSQTGTAMATNLRTPDDYLEAKRDCWELHGVSIERAGIYGERFEGTDGETGKKKRATRGLVKAIQQDSYAGSNCCDDFSTATTIDDDTGGDPSYDYSGKTWEQAGERFINYYLKNRARYSSTREVIGVCGDGALLGINRLAMDNSLMTVEPGKKVDYGLIVTVWKTVFGTIYLITHPLFSHEPSDNFRMVLYEPKELMFRPLEGRDTKFLKDPNFEKGGENAVDAKNEGYRTEGGFDFGNMRGGAVLDGIGKDNTQGA